MNQEKKATGNLSIYESARQKLLQSNNILYEVIVDNTILGINIIENKELQDNCSFILDKINVELEQTRNLVRQAIFRVNQLEILNSEDEK